MVQRSWQPRRLPRQAEEDAQEAAAKAAVDVGDVPLAFLVVQPARGGRGRCRSSGQGRSRRRVSQQKLVAGVATPSEPGSSCIEEFSAADLYSCVKETKTTATASSKVIGLRVLSSRAFEAHHEEASVDIMVDSSTWWLSRLKSGVLGPFAGLLARHCLGVPGSSALLLCCFSQAGRAVTPKRASLSREHATNLKFLHENMRQGVV